VNPTLSVFELKVLDLLTIVGVYFPSDDGGEAFAACKRLVALGLVNALECGGFELTEKGQNTFNG